MAPGYGDIRLLTYIIGVAIAIVISVFLGKIRYKNKSNRWDIVAIAIGFVMLFSSVGLRIVYESKVDTVMSSVPPSRVVYLKFDMDEEFYAYYDGYVREPYSYMVFGEHKYENSGTIKVKLDQTYIATIGAGYQGEVGIKSSGQANSKKISIVFPKEKINNGYTITEEVMLGSKQAEVTIDFERICTFWEVVLY